MDPLPPVRHLTARLSPTLRAVIGAQRPLHYAAAGAAGGDLPAHVRAASAIRRHGSRRVVLQDDVNALALIEPDGSVVPLLLPAGAAGARVFDDLRGNKQHKLDLEAGVVLPDGTLIAFGSGSSAMRERLAILPRAGSPRLLPATDLYASLRRCSDRLGVELNIEGAVIQRGRLRLLQRGNDPRGHGVRTGNAVLDLPLAALADYVAGNHAVPEVLDILAVDLGATHGVGFGFTDAALTQGGRLAFLACAEDSPDVRRDGPVHGCRFGWLDDDAATMCDIVDEQDRPVALKLEGIEARVDDRAEDVLRFDVVADMDRPDEPAVLAELRVGA